MKKKGSLDLDLIVSKFDEIKTAVNEAIAEVVSEKHSGKWDNAGVNWLDFQCANVDFVIGKNYRYYHATVKEVSPTSYDLRRFIQNKVDKLNVGYDIWVETEW